MSNVHHPSYIEKTESYIEEYKNTMSSEVYNFIKTVCADEKKYYQLVNDLNREKKVFKV